MEATNPTMVLKFEPDPTAAPSRAPTRAPSGAPTRVPTTDVPTFEPTSLPTCTRTVVTTSATVAAFSTSATVDYIGDICRYAILAETAITNTGALDLTGDVGLSPIGFAFIVGLGLKLDSSKAFSKSAMVDGEVFAADYMGGTTTVDLKKDIIAMEALHLEMSTMTPTDTIAATSISGLDFTPGVYYYGGAITSAASTKATFTGGPDDIFVIQAGGALSLGANFVIELVGGVQEKNIFWTCTAATFGADAKFKGVLLASTAASYGAGAEHVGHIYVQSALTMGDGVVIKAIPCA
jgi:hypothetical protein